jgi:hypothetical protein
MLSQSSLKAIAKISALIVHICILVGPADQFKLRSSVKYQQIDCGVVYIAESDDNMIPLLANETYHHTEIANLNGCINKLTANYFFDDHVRANYSWAAEADDTLSDHYFDTRFANKNNEITFSKFFSLQRQTGRVYLRKNIDRESYCNEVKEFSVTGSPGLHNGKPSHTNSFSSKFVDLINCQCKSLTCEMRFVFVAFANRSLIANRNHTNVSFSLNLFGLSKNACFSLCLSFNCSLKEL